MSTIKNIYQFIDYKGISVNEFSKKTAVSNGYFAKQRASEGAVSSTIIEKIVIEYPEINPEWLITGKGNMIRTEMIENLSIVPIKKSISKKIEAQEVPLYDLEASASIKSIFLNTNKLVPMDYIRIPNLPKVDGAIRITGDSMYPLLKSGDIVIYKEGNDKNFIIWGEIYLVYVQNNEGEEYFAIKYLKKSEKEGYIRLISYNDHHAPQEFPIDYLKKWALVKASIRINSAL